MGRSLGEIEFLADTLLIQKVVAMDFEIHKSILKNADMASSVKGMLGDGLSIIKDSVKGLVDTSSTTSILESVGNIFATGALFRLWWPLGIINAIGSSFFGINAVSIAEKIWNYVKSKLMNGQAVSPADVSSITKSVAGVLGSAGARNEDPFKIIRLADQQGKLFTLIKSAKSSQSDFMYWLKSLPRMSARQIIGGFIGWAVKAALLGAGLLTLSNAAANLFGVHPKKEEVAESDKPTGGAFEDAEPTISDNKKQLTPTGNGQTHHENDHVQSNWIVPLTGNLENTLLNWAAYVYKEFQDKSLWTTIASSTQFDKIVGELSTVLEPGSNQLTVPTKFKSIKQIVDGFAQDAANKLL